MTHRLKNTATAVLFSLLLPLMVVGGGGKLLAQSIQVKTLSADYTNHQVTFSVSWAAGTRDATHLSKVWVFVDFAALISANSLGTWQRADISSATTTAGTISGLTGQGFFLEGSTGAFSSTVTATLSSVPTKYSWCAFAIDYPPTAILNNGAYTLSGTSPFVINGTYTEPSFTYSGGMVTSIIDASGYEGIVISAPVVSTTSPTAVCAGNPVTLTATASGGTTTAMTYTWNINGSTTNTASNTFTVPAASITVSMTYSVSTINEYGTTSNTASGSITVNSPGTNGCPPAGSTNWTTCSGFSYVSNVANEGFMNWSTANTFCQNKGMRLPTRTELECMCAHKASLSGGYGRYWYWSSTPNGSYYYLTDFGDCDYFSDYPSTGCAIKCVK